MAVLRLALSICHRSGLGLQQLGRWADGGGLRAWRPPPVCPKEPFGGCGGPSSQPHCRDAPRSRGSPGSTGRWRGGWDGSPPPLQPHPDAGSPLPSAAVTSEGSGGGRARRSSLQLGSAPRGSAHPPPLGARPGSRAPLPASLRWVPRSSAPAYPHPGASAYPGACGCCCRLAPLLPPRERRRKAAKGSAPPPRRRAPPASRRRTQAPRPPPPPRSPPRPAPVTNRGRDCFKERAPS